MRGLAGPMVSVVGKVAQGRYPASPELQVASWEAMWVLRHGACRETLWGLILAITLEERRGSNWHLDLGFGTSWFWYKSASLHGPGNKSESLPTVGIMPNCT